jgi:phosphatidylserine decarboxylase
MKTAAFMQIFVVKFVFSSLIQLEAEQYVLLPEDDYSFHSMEPHRLLRRIVKLFGFAEYGADEMLIAIISCGSAAYALSLAHPFLAFIPLVPFLIVLWFFRDPNRQGPQDADLLLSPADGTVSDITEVDEPHFIRGKAMRIGIFLSPFNVHVNRMPCDGTVQHIQYKAGEFLPAYNPAAPERNESVAMGIQTPDGLRLVVKQVTGILARRIICTAKIGDVLSRGQRYGMIKFGSRTELYIPIETFVSSAVKLGDKVSGGSSVCCKIRVLQSSPLPLPVQAEAALPVNQNQSGEVEGMPAPAGG